MSNTCRCSAVLIRSNTLFCTCHARPLLAVHCNCVDDQDITTCQAGGKDCVQKSACDRFDGLCRTQYVSASARLPPPDELLVEIVLAYVPTHYGHRVPLMSQTQLVCFVLPSRCIACVSAGFSARAPSLFSCAYVDVYLPFLSVFLSFCHSPRLSPSLFLSLFRLSASPSLCLCISLSCSCRARARAHTHTRGAHAAWCNLAMNNYPNLFVHLNVYNLLDQIRLLASCVADVWIKYGCSLHVCWIKYGCSLHVLLTATLCKYDVA